ncbi:acyltransferase family protein [Methylophilus sp.]|uniref:acyltransferase family protein n=1 Tax=Methylophilus sp. TaxID=29541 RepID=UPI0011D5BECE|nr:acyltransferase family protein [Methylophilus sp.]TXI45807.1 MAG: acyltransferase [Methylophilus sp.]
MAIPDNNNNVFKNGFYRPEIDGLRAIAILFVVVFHAFPQKFTGGFIGVDVFFVISGYLISSIIFKEIAAGKFSILAFYKKRINRIYPALIFVLLVSILISKAVLFKAEIADFNLSVFFSTIFLANIYFLNTLNYFDNSAENHPLLHLWSLGVEEQFYIFWPLLLILIAPKSFYFSLKTISFFLVTSFLLNLFFVSTYQSNVFYMPFTRLWELGFGSLCALFLNNLGGQITGRTSTPFYSNLMTLLGVTVIFCSGMFIKSTDSFPGWLAIFPVLGSGLIILYSGSNNIGKWLLGNKFLVFIGLISYPLYLWHWPILAFGHIHYGYLMDKNIKLGLIFVSIILAITTYYCVENPLRYKVVNTKKSLILFFALFLLGVYSAFSYFQLQKSSKTISDIFVSNHKNYVTLNEWTVKNRTHCGFIDYKGVLVDEIKEECVEKNKKVGILLWGDSHAFQLYYGLHKSFGDKYQLNQLTSSGCRPFLENGGNLETLNCKLSNLKALNHIKILKPEMVIIAQKDLHDQTDWNLIANWLQNIGVRKVVLIGPAPQWHQYLYRYLAKQYPDIKSIPKYLNKQVLNSDLIKVDEDLKHKYSKQTNIHYISLIDILCDELLGCMTFIDDGAGEELTTFDYGHLGLKASVFVSDAIFNSL